MANAQKEQETLDLVPMRNGINLSLESVNQRLLRVKRVKPVTLLRYSDHVDDFLQRCRRHQKSTNTCRLADKALSVYMNALFEDGATLTSAGYTLFGFIALKTVR